MKKYSKKVKNAIIKSLEGGNKILATCKAAGVDYSTYKDWLDENSPRFDSLFSQSVKNALDQGVKVIEEICVDVILKAATNEERPAWTAAAWMLERTMPERYANKSNIDHTTNGENISTVIILPDNGREK